MWTECCNWGSIDNDDDGKNSADTTTAGGATADASSSSSSCSLQKGRIVRAVLMDNDDAPITSMTTSTTIPQIQAVEFVALIVENDKQVLRETKNTSFVGCEPHSIGNFAFLEIAFHNAIIHERTNG